MLIVLTININVIISVDVCQNICLDIDIREGSKRWAKKLMNPVLQQLQQYW